MHINRSRIGLGLLMLVVIYVALIPAFFDLSLGHAAILSDADYAKAYHYYATRYDISVHDGPGLNQSLELLGRRIELLDNAMRTAMDTKRWGLIPRWYNPHADYYIAIQRQSFIHLLYPFV